MTPTTYFLWGLRRSGNHLIADWLYTNLGARAKQVLDSSDIHRQLRQAQWDPDAGVAFYNNCGQLNSRQFRLGLLSRADFEAARKRHRVTIFGFEDCPLHNARRTPTGTDTVQVLVLRDPLNNIASRLEGAKARPEMFRVDEQYVELLTTYCEEYLGRSDRLGEKVRVNYNDFIRDRAYRDSRARELGVDNVDAVTEVSHYGGGSSFENDGVMSKAALLNRFRQHPIPGDILHRLLEREAVRDVCTTVFGYDLDEIGSTP